MRTLRFQKLLLLSPTARRAREIEFHPKITILTGGNGSGKSTLAKSLYYTFGCTIPNLKTDRWSTISPISFVSFKISNQQYGLLRDGSSFGLFDGKDKLIGVYQGVSRDGGISKKIADLLDFSLTLETKDGKEKLISPGHFFLPFYIDQEKGWGNSWAESFDGLQMFSDYRKKLIEYHLGIKPEEYYVAKKKSEDLSRIILEKNNEKDKVNLARSRVASSINGGEVKINYDDFEQDIKIIEEKTSELSIKQQEIRKDLVSYENEKFYILNELSLIERAKHELSEDYKFATHKSEGAEEVECPTCGTVHQNSISTRFALLDDIQACDEIKNSLTERLGEVRERLSQLMNERESIRGSLNELQQYLSVTKNDQTLNDLIDAKAKSSLNTAFNETINKIVEELIALEISLEKIQKEMNSYIDKERTKEINNTYQRKMKTCLRKLSIFSVAEEKYKNPTQNVVNKISGNDIPRSVLAQSYAFLGVMAQHSPTPTSCPIVIDTPLQQEPDPKHLPAIFKFIFDDLPLDSQLILATVQIKGYEPSSKDTYKIIDNGEIEFNCLKPDQFEAVNSRLSPMIDAMLKALEN